MRASLSSIYALSGLLGLIRERESMLFERSKSHGVVIVDANRCGKGLDGRSMIIAPYSDVPLASTGSDHSIAIAEVQLK